MVEEMLSNWQITRAKTFDTVNGIAYIVSNGLDPTDTRLFFPHFILHTGSQSDRNRKVKSTKKGPMTLYRNSPFDARKSKTKANADFPQRPSRTSPDLVNYYY